MNDYSQAAKSGLLQAFPGVNFTKEQDMTISGKSAHAIELELAQQLAGKTMIFG
ncbi:MAG: hypothetical protein QMD86_02440 [Patescibacteria group bacterium]|nr:hypothetical protein [Patescibacteria group bacterium]